MAKTRSDLIVQAAANLGAPGTGQTLSAEDAAKLGGYIDAVVETLSERDVADIDTSDIPLAWFLPLSNIVSSAAAAEYGAANDARIILLGQQGEKMLWEMNAVKPTHNRAKAEYF